MAAPKGHKRYGGRIKGTPNKGTLDVKAKALAMGVDPFEVLLLFAAGRYKELGYLLPIEPSVRAKCASDACKYLYPQRKAIVLSEDPESPVGESATNKALEKLKELHAEAARERKRG